MSAGNATIISPMITKQIIKQEIDLDIKEEDEKCILYISSSANGSLTLNCNEESLDVKNGHNYTSATKASNQNTSTSTLSLQRDRLNTVSTTANRSTVKRIDFSKQPNSNNLVSSNWPNVPVINWPLIVPFLCRISSAHQGVWSILHPHRHWVSMSPIPKTCSAQALCPATALPTHVSTRMT